MSIQNIFFVHFHSTAGRYGVASGTGNLYIRSVRSEDSLKKFSCEILNILTGERKLSDHVFLTIKGESRSGDRERELLIMSYITIPSI